MAPDRLARFQATARGLLARAPWPCALLVSTLGWLLFASGSRSIALASICGDLLRPDASWTLIAALNPPGALLAGWLAMLAAMLPPMQAESLRRTWLGSARRNRLVKCLALVTGYAAVWLATLPVMLGLVAIFAPLGQPLIAALVLAGLWLVSPWRQRCLNTCHRHTRLPAYGGQALIAAAGAGIASGGWCVAVCLPVMLPAMLAEGWHLAAMFATGLLLALERQFAPVRPRWFAIAETLGLRPKPISAAVPA